MSLARQFLLACCLVAIGSAATAQPADTDAAIAARQLEGLTADEANKIIATLEEAQRQLKAGQFQHFELLSGSIASYSNAELSPRQVFLETPFAKSWMFKRMPTDTKLWQPFRLSYRPAGPDRRYWDIEVVLGMTGKLERVLLFYKPPAPF